MEPPTTNLSMPDKLEITTCDIEQLVQDLFESMIGTSVARVEPRSDDVFAGGLCGQIRIEGAWSASLNVSATRTLCDILCSAIFGCDLNSLDTEDLSDAVGEIANVIGGNVKGIINQDCKLSIPEVVPFEAKPQTEAEAVWFDWCGQSLCVELNVD